MPQVWPSCLNRSVCRCVNASNLGTRVRVHVECGSRAVSVPTQLALQKNAAMKLLRFRRHEVIANRRFSLCTHGAMVKIGPRPVPLSARDGSPSTLHGESVRTGSGDHHNTDSRRLDVAVTRMSPDSD